MQLFFTNKYFRKVLPTFFSVLCIACIVFPANTANAASLYLFPKTVNVSAGDIVNLNVIVDTQGQAINTSDATIEFPADILQVISVSKNSSIFSLWVQEPAFSNTTGEISFGGGIPTPGYSGGNGQLVSISFRAKKAGTATVSFTDGDVLANDGLGTDLLTSKNSSTVNIASAAAATAPIIAPAPAVIKKVALIIQSPTHPEQEKWYANDSPKFTWDLPDNAVSVRTSVGDKALSVPNVLYATPISSKLVTNLADGKYYFSLQVKDNAGWGTATSYQVRIDTMPPKVFTVDVQPTETGNEATFSTTDDLSGMDHYAMLVNDVQVATFKADKVQGPVAIPPTQAGSSKLTIVAYDKAGNTRSASATYIAVAPVVAVSAVAPAPKAEEAITISIKYALLFSYFWIFVKYLQVFLAVAGVVGVVMFFVWYVWHRLHKVRRALIRHIASTDLTLHSELIEINKALQKRVDELEAEKAAREAAPK